MEENNVLEVLSFINDSFDDVFTLESLIKSICETCQSRELNSSIFSENISIERNDYINLLKIALEKLSSLKENILFIENKTRELEQYTNNCC